MIKIISSLCLLGFFLTACAAINSFASGGNLLISEVAYKGTASEDNCKASVSSTFNCGHDKWVEIYNPSSTAVDLSQYRLAYGRQGSGYTENRALSGTIQPNSYFVIGNKTNSSLTNLPGVDLLMSNMHFMSGNSGDKYLKVAIFNQFSVLVDKVELNNSQITGLESGFDFSQSKFSIEFRDGVPSVNQSNSYGRSPAYKNFGTPGYGSLIPVPQKIEPVAEVKPVVTTVVQSISTPKVEATTASPQSIASPVVAIEQTQTVPQTTVQPIIPSIKATEAVAPSPTGNPSPRLNQVEANLPTQNQVIASSVEVVATPTAVIATTPSAVVRERAVVAGPRGGDTVVAATQAGVSSISPETVSSSVLVNNTFQSTYSQPITQAIATAKVSQSSYELILTIIAINVIIFVGYTLFDYNYNRIDGSHLDKITNIVSY